MISAERKFLCDNWVWGHVEREGIAACLDDEATIYFWAMVHGCREDYKE
jgi:hypothetical protein